MSEGTLSHVTVHLIKQNEFPVRKYDSGSLIAWCVDHQNGKLKVLGSRPNCCGYICFAQLMT